jgi:hypothetical protein
MRRWRNVVARLVAVVGVAAVVGAMVSGFSGAAMAEGSSLAFTLSNVNAAGGSAVTMSFGPAGFGLPVVGNWDRAANGRDTVGVSLVDGAQRRWVLASGNSSGGATAPYNFLWGHAVCTPVAGNWQARGDAIGEACKDTHTNKWRWSLASGLAAGGAGVFRTYEFGAISCTPITGDWDGDDVDTVGVSCPTPDGGRQWVMTNRPGDGVHDPIRSISFGWGNAACTPVVGDWDGIAGANADTVGETCAPDGDGSWQWVLSNHNSGGGSDAVFNWGSPNLAPITGNWDGQATANHTNADTPGVVAGISTIPTRPGDYIIHDRDNISEVKSVGHRMMLDAGWPESEWTCLDQLWTGESHWQWNADNPRSSAYGIPQALPGSKMADAGADWQTNPVTQIRWGLGYIDGRYGTPCAALAFWQSHTPHWY